jgi:hypothetical protein
VSTPIIPIPRSPVTVRPATPADLPFIDSLQKRHAKQVGWMPTRALEQKILRQEPLGVAPPPPSPAMQRTVSETAVVLSTARLVLPTGQSVPIPGRGLRIGRMEDNDLVVEGVKVSRYHAVVVEMGGGFAVNDLRSTNGTLVGEQRVLDSHFLRSGDVIRIGGTDLIFEMDA